MWAREHLYLGNTDDMALAFLSQTGPILRTMLLLRSDSSMAPDLKEAMFRELADQARRLHVKWFGPYCESRSPGASDRLLTKQPECPASTQQTRATGNGIC